MEMQNMNTILWSAEGEIRTPQSYVPDRIVLNAIGNSLLVSAVGSIPTTVAMRYCRKRQKP